MLVATGQGLALAVNAAIATNIINGSALASIVSSDVETTVGDLSVTASNNSAIIAETQVATTTSGNAAGIVLACALTREDARDALVLAGDPPVDPGDPFASLPAGAVIGTASVRRQSQLLHARPDLRVEMIRGNVQTRLAKLRAPDGPAATLLALAGLRRLELEHEASLVLDPDAMVPAACQGIIGVTVRADDVELLELLSGIEDSEARAVSTAERALLAALDGSCRTPIGGHARVLPDGRLHLTGLVARADGSFLLERS
ncbi:MAG: hydroxymethylbilane synthase, partial [Pseudomonas sp.]|nr:hydroxymethylbilane synthase [Pseudomonas sp.]